MVEGSLGHSHEDYINETLVLDTIISRHYYCDKIIKYSNLRFSIEVSESGNVCYVNLIKTTC